MRLTASQLRKIIRETVEQELGTSAGRAHGNPTPVSMAKDIEADLRKGIAPISGMQLSREELLGVLRGDRSLFRDFASDAAEGHLEGDMVYGMNFDEFVDQTTDALAAAFGA